MRLLETFASLQRKRWFRWLLEGLFLLALLWGVQWFQTRHLVEKGQAAPPLELSTLSGAPVSLAGLVGKPVALVFWAPWCGVCGAQSGNVSRVHTWLSGRAHVVSVAVGYQDIGQVKAYMAQNQVTYPVWLGTEETVDAWKLRAFPTIYFLDATGRLQGSLMGYTPTLGLWARLWWASVVGANPTGGST